MWCPRPKAEAACATGVLHSDFSELLPPEHTILPGHLHKCMLPELLSPAVMWDLIYSVEKIQSRWAFWLEIIFLLTLLSPVLQHEASCPFPLPGAFFCGSVSLEVAFWEMFSAVTEHLQLCLLMLWSWDPTTGGGNICFKLLLSSSETFPLFSHNIKARADKSQALMYKFTFCSFPDLTEDTPVFLHKELLTGGQWYPNFAFTVSFSSSRCFRDLDGDA